METRMANGTNLAQAERLQRTGGGVLRWSLVFLLVFFGALKWTPAEAQAVAPFIDNSPFLAWMGRALGRAGASEAIGIIELTTACSLPYGTGRPEPPWLEARSALARS